MEIIDKRDKIKVRISKIKMKYEMKRWMKEDEL